MPFYVFDTSAQGTLMKLQYVKYLPLILLVAYFIKIIIVSATFVDAAIMLILGAIIFIYEHKSHNNQMLIMENKVRELDAALKIQVKYLEENRTAVASLKMNSGFAKKDIRF
jgi:hypothetical protein